jgi:hypothetical protein
MFITKKIFKQYLDIYNHHASFLLHVYRPLFVGID